MSGVTSEAVSEFDSILDADRVLTAAREATGLSDFGDEAIEAHVAADFVAVAKRAREGHVNPAAIAAQTQGWLETRLRLEEAFRRNPEILDEELVAPIVVLGLPRTGTTKLQRMLASDPRAQRTELWRLLTPVPVPGATPGEPDPRISIAERTVEAVAAAAPDFMAAHPWLARDVEEDTFLQMYTPCTPAVAMRLSDRDYLTATLSRLPAVYEHERKILQYLQWQDGGARGRHWVLKAPNHLGNLELLTQLYPGATIVTTHRAVETCIPSIMRLLEAVFNMGNSEFLGMGDPHLDLAEVGSFTLDFYALEMARYLEQRDRLGLDSEIIDAHFSEIVQDPFAVVGRIYDRRGWELTEEVKQEMIKWESHNPADKYGKHVYSLERYSVSPEKVRETFADYSARFGLV